MSEAWRYAGNGVSLALRVTPRGGRDGVDGIETLANGRQVLKVRVRAVAEDGEANKAVITLLSQSLRVPRSSIRLVAGATARIKQLEIDGDPRTLADALCKLSAPGIADRKEDKSA